MKDKLRSSLGSFGVFLWYILTIFLIVAPMLILDFGSLWLNTVLSSVFLFVILLVPVFGPIVHFALFVWSFVVAINSPVTTLSVLYYVAAAIYLFTTIIPYIVGGCIFLIAHLPFRNSRSSNSSTNPDQSDVYCKAYAAGVGDERARNDREWDQFFADAQLTNMHRNQPIRSRADFQQWKTDHENARENTVRPSKSSQKHEPPSQSHTETAREHMNSHSCNKQTSTASHLPENEPTYLMETKDGFLMRVPESKLDAWLKAQEEPGAPLTEQEQLLKDKLMEKIYGSKK